MMTSLTVVITERSEVATPYESVLLHFEVALPADVCTTLTLARVDDPYSPFGPFRPSESLMFARPTAPQSLRSNRGATRPLPRLGRATISRSARCWIYRLTQSSLTRGCEGVMLRPRAHLLRVGGAGLQ